MSRTPQRQTPDTLLADALRRIAILEAVDPAVLIADSTTLDYAYVSFTKFDTFAGTSSDSVAAGIPDILVLNSDPLTGDLKLGGTRIALGPANSFTIGEGIWQIDVAVILVDVAPTAPFLLQINQDPLFSYSMSAHVESYVPDGGAPYQPSGSGPFPAPMNASTTAGVVDTYDYLSTLWPYHARANVLIPEGQTADVWAAALTTQSGLFLVNQGSFGEAIPAVSNISIIRLGKAAPEIV